MLFLMTRSTDSLCLCAEGDHVLGHNFQCAHNFQYAQTDLVLKRSPPAGICRTLSDCIGTFDSINSVVRIR